MKKIHVKGPIIPSNYQPVYDYFGMEATSPKKVAKLIDEALGDELEVEINSGGGDVFSGSEIYTALKSYKGNVTVNIVGVAASAASVIAMAGKRVRMTPTGQFMIHNASTIAEGDHRDMLHAADMLKNVNQSIANAYMLKTGMDSKALLSLMDKESWLDAKKAKENGFIDEVMFDSGGQITAAMDDPDAMLPKAVIEKVLNDLNDTDSKERCFLMQKKQPAKAKGKESAMTKQEYLDKRNAMLAEAESLLEAGKSDERKQKQADVESLDNQWDDIAKEIANLNALKEQPITNLANKSIAVKEAKQVEMITNAKTVIDANSPEYRAVWLKQLQGKQLSQFENEYTVAPDTAAGTVPTQTANMIFDSMTKIAPMLSEIQLLRVPGNLRFVVQGTRNAAAVHVEGAAITPDLDTVTSVVLGGFEFTKVVRISATVQAMGIDAFEAWIAQIIGEELAVIIDNEIINTANTTGGIIDGPAGGWVNGTNQITYVPGVGLTHKNLMDLIALLPAAYDRNAKFLMNKATFWGQVRAIEDANGNPIFEQDVSAPGKYLIAGYPVLIDDNVAASEAYLGDYKKVVGNLSSDIKIDRSTESGFLNNSIDFRGTAIFDCDVADPRAIVKLNV